MTTTMNPRARLALLAAVALVAIASLVVVWSSGRKDPAPSAAGRPARKAPATPRPRVANPARGDVNADGKVDKDDVDYLAAFIFTKGPAPIGDGDVTGDGKVDQSDMFYLATFASGGMPTPASPAARTPARVP